MDTPGRRNKGKRSCLPPSKKKKQCPAVNLMEKWYKMHGSKCPVNAYFYRSTVQSKPIVDLLRLQDRTLSAVLFSSFSGPLLGFGIVAAMTQVNSSYTSLCDTITTSHNSHLPELQWSAFDPNDDVFAAEAIELINYKLGVQYRGGISLRGYSPTSSFVY